MDRRYLLALLFSLLIIIFYPHYLRWIGVSQHQEPAPPPSGTAVLQQKIDLPKESSKPLKPPAPSPAAVFPYKNSVYEIIFTTRGGNIHFLKEAETVLYEGSLGDKGIFGLNILHEPEDLSQAFFETLPTQDKETPPAFVYEKAGQYRITKIYHVGIDKSTLVLEVMLENLSDKEKHFPLELQYGLNLGVHNGQDETKVKEIRSFADEIRSTDLRSLKKKPHLSTEPAEWHGLLKKYYAILVKPETKLVGSETRFEDEKLASYLFFPPTSLAPGGRTSIPILIYAGPQRYHALKEFGVGFEKIFTQGMLGILHMGLLMTLGFFYQLTGNYGTAILLITLLIKGLFTPLTHLSYQSMGKMQALQPKIKSLQKQHEKDPTRMNKELMELYRRNRVNPMMGCLPLVLQIPIFISFYQVLSDAVELKGAGFIWWIRDLSAPDRLFTLPTSLPFIGDAINLLPILMIGSMVWQQKLTPQTAATPGQEKIMYLMPIIFGFVFYNLPSGLVLYWIANNLLTIFHQLVIKRIPVILHHEDT